MSRGYEYGAVTAQILRLLQAGTERNEVARVTGICGSDASSMLARLAKQGRAFRAKRHTGRVWAYTYFAHEKDRDDWQAAHPYKIKARSRKQYRKPKPEKVSKPRPFGQGKVQQMVIKAVKDAGPAGISARIELAKATGHKDAYDSARRLVQRGVLFSVLEGTGNYGHRYFFTKEWRDAWMPVPKLAPAPKQKSEKPAGVVIKKVIHKPTPDAEMIITDETIRTDCRHYTHDYRFQLPPGERVIGGFASMGIGRYVE